MIVRDWTFPHKIGVVLLDPDRYNVFFGGRDSAKSWSVARNFLIDGTQEVLPIGCFREVQKSIKDSVHQLLSNQIEELGLSSFYEILRDEIRGENGTYFRFAGLSAQTRDSIKSFEGLKRAWVEEAQSVSKRSWDILIPTIRAPGSKIYVTFNPDMETDDTYQRFVVNPPPNAKVVHVNYTDNPFRSRVLDPERERMKVEAPDDFAHIYLGHCRPAVEGAIYYTEVSALKAANRLCVVPYDPLLKVHRVWDLGFNDYMSILLVQKQASGIRIIGYLEDRLRTYDSYITELKALNYNWGTDYLPHDGRAKTPESGRSPEMILQALGCKVEIVEDIGLENGIKAARQMFPRVWIDKQNAGELVSRLGRYRRRVSKETGQATTPMHDDESHGADGFRYLAVCESQMSNDDVAPLVDPFRAFRRAG